MNQLNYTTTLPDFITMQRASFCWFLTQGLSEELRFFSQILDFSQNTEYALYGEEYGLLKPPCTLAVARKYSGNYRAQLVIPIEVRNKKTNTVYFYSKFPLITLPLMTTAATFILNGCERVIVSQIIRSPGIYFEKVKNQKRQRPFKRKLSTEITKLRSFLPAGQASLSDTDLFFATPSINYEWKEKSLVILPHWTQKSVLAYSLNFFKQSKTSTNYSYLFFALKTYQTFLKLPESAKKPQLIYLFYKWLLFFQIKSNIYKVNSKSSQSINYIIQYFNSLTNLVNNYKKINGNKNLDEDIILQKYENIIQFSLKLCQFYLNKNLLLLTKLSNLKINSLNNFSLLKQNLENDSISYSYLSNFNNLLSLRSTIYFSKSLKDQLRYTFKKISDISYSPDRHQYTKSKTRLLIFNDDHKVLTNYDKKYSDKELYTATLIPEYGSWIRFGFQKNLKINPYNYPIKHQEEYVTIQLDKITQKSVLSLLKEMGLSDLEIYQNLEHRDFFYFTKPLLIHSLTLNQPLLRFQVPSNQFSQISEFLRIFDPSYYRLGKIGRIQINKRLNTDISERYQTITYEDIFAITDKLITLTISKTIADDIDHLKNRRVRSVGELLQNLFRIGFQRLVRKLRNQTNNIDSTHLLSFNIVNATVKEFFGSSQLSQYLDQTNLRMRILEFVKAFHLVKLSKDS